MQQDVFILIGKDRYRLQHHFGNWWWASDIILLIVLSRHLALRLTLPYKVAEVIHHLFCFVSDCFCYGAGRSAIIQALCGGQEILRGTSSLCFAHRLYGG